jgi:hypothetical protein
MTMSINEVSWTGVVGGKDKKFLGWQLAKDWANLPIDTP